MQRTLISLIHEASEKNPNKPYAYRKVGTQWQATTFRQMEEQAHQLAAFFLSLGYEQGNHFAIFAEGSPEWINAEFGAIYAQMITVPLSIKLSKEEILFRIHHAEIHLIAASEYTIARLFDVYDSYQDFTILWLDKNRDVILDLAKGNGFPLKNIIFFDDALESGKALLETPQYRRRIDDIAANTDENLCVSLTYSSGTTGNPKGVMLSHKNCYSNATTAKELVPVPYGASKSLLILPCDHSFGHTAGIYISLILAGALYFVDGQGGPTKMIRNIPTNITEVKPNYILLVPALANSFIKRIWSKIRHKGPLLEKLFRRAIKAGTKMFGDGFHPVPITTKLKYFWDWFLLGQLFFFPRIKKSLPFQFSIGGGAYFDPKIQEFFAAIGIPLYQGYGLSEASPIVSSNYSAKGALKIGTSGPLFKGVECRILRSDGTLANSNEIGEVTVRGDNVMLGYYKNPEETAKTIRNGWLHTGDMGFLDEDNFLVIAGREKALLISKDGEKHNPEAMEDAIAQSSSNLISQCLLYCEHRPYVVALIVLDYEELELLVKSMPQPISLSALNQKVADRFFGFKNDPAYAKTFPPIWTPNTYHLVTESFQVNSTMKIVRYKVFEKYAEELDHLYTPEGSKSNHEGNIKLLGQKLKEWKIPTIE